MAVELDAIRTDFDALGERARPAQVARVAVWLASHLPEVAWNTVGDVAQSAGASPATVVRALQRAGYSGFSELQARVRACLPPSELVWKLARGDASGTGDSTLGRIVDQEKANLDQLEAAVGREASVLAGLLAGAQHTWVIAALTSVPIGQHLALHLDLLLGNVTFTEAASVRSLTAIPSLRPDDLVIGLSFPRYAQATLDDLAEAAKAAPTVVVTDRKGPTLQGVTLTLKLPTLSEVHFSSSVALVTLTMALARLLHERETERVEANLARIDRAWAERGVMRRPPRGRRGAV
jgi:DNA-binding MurR/RpiR family transcriptional regulator